MQDRCQYRESINQQLADESALASHYLNALMLCIEPRRCISTSRQLWCPAQISVINGTINTGAAFTQGLVTMPAFPAENDSYGGHGEIKKAARYGGLLQLLPLTGNWSI